MIVSVLLALGDPAALKRYRRLLQGSQTVLTRAATQADLLQKLNEGASDLILIEPGLLPDSTREWVASLQGLPDRPDVVVLWEGEDPQQRAALLAAGCLAMLNNTLPDEDLRQALLALIDRRRRAAPAVLEEERPKLESHLQDFVSDSPSMQHFLSMARQVAAIDSSVLLLGETGVGKEHLARAIHRGGSRAKGAFLAINCAAFPETLLESELFGHERGAFTGAVRTRKGYFELAHKGTIFLDEIAEIPLHLQAKLLRVLDDHRIQRIGSEKPVDVDVRIMAATNRDLAQEAAAGRFRSDLYFRLAVITLELPPLRDRREDIPGLARSYLDHFARTLGRPVKQLTVEALQALVDYAWPGNVRELINVIERSVILTQGDTVGLEMLPAVVSGQNAAATWAATDKEGLYDRMLALWGDKPLKDARQEVLAGFERSYLEAKLQETGGRVGETAELAGINVRSLYKMMRDHGLQKEAFNHKAADRADEK